MISSSIRIEPVVFHPKVEWTLTRFALIVRSFSSSVFVETPNSPFTVSGARMML